MIARAPSCKWSSAQMRQERTLIDSGRGFIKQNCRRAKKFSFWKLKSLGKYFVFLKKNPTNSQKHSFVPFQSLWEIFHSFWPGLAQESLYNFLSGCTHQSIHWNRMWLIQFRSGVIALLVPGGVRQDVWGNLFYWTKFWWWRRQAFQLLVTWRALWSLKGSKSWFSKRLPASPTLSVLRVSVTRVPGTLWSW